MSIANITNTAHVLFGTYELLNCCSLSGQLSRRSEDIHLPRYHNDITEDVTEFIKVIQTFQLHLPLPQESTLIHWYEYLFDYSNGCVGILKTWLIKALRNALTEESKTLTLKHLKLSEYSPSRRKLLREEALAGERRCQNETSFATPCMTQTKINQIDSKQQPSRKRCVGKRHPKRDPVGVDPDAS